MKQRGWPVVLLAFAMLTAFIVVAGSVIYRYVGGVQRQLQQTQDDYRERDRLLTSLRFDTLYLAIELRDYLLNPSPASDAERKVRLLEFRDSILRSLTQAENQKTFQDQGRIRDLRERFDTLWESVNTVLGLTPEERQSKGPAFLMTKVFPSREAMILVTREISDLNSALLERRQASILQALDAVQTRLIGVLAITASFGLIVAILTTLKMRALESRAERHRQQTEESADELRRLSQRLVQAQEEERKAISRELHDEVGQMLTALRMELGAVRKQCDSGGGSSGARIDAADSLAEKTLQTVRDMARGLRPAMLDELGLSSALKSHARQFSRHSGISVNLEVHGNVDSLPESHRTCAYRVVQEALTNCARHASAKQVRVTLRGSSDLLSLRVQDDGTGFSSQPASRRGLGLLGIEERVRELGGSVSLISQPRGGALLSAEIPLPPESLT